MAGTYLEIAPGIVGVNPTSNLKALWVGLQSFAGSRLVPGPSWMTWPPLSPSLRYSSAYHPLDRSETKFVSGSGPSSLRLPPTICLTLPWCRSMQGLNMSWRAG